MLFTIPRMRYLLDATERNRLWFDQGCKRGRVCLHGLLGQTIEQFAERRRGGTVESKSELVEVIVQMSVCNRAPISAEQPSLQQRDHAMDARKQVFSLLPMALYLAVMHISVQAQICKQTVCSDRAARRNGLSNEPVQAGLGHVRDRAKTNASDAFSILLSGDDNQGLELRLSADCASFLPAPVGLVHLHDAIQPIATRANHGPTQLV